MRICVNHLAELMWTGAVCGYELWQAAWMLFSSAYKENKLIIGIHAE